MCFEIHSFINLFIYSVFSPEVHCRLRLCFPKSAERYMRGRGKALIYWDLLGWPPKQEMSISRRTLQLGFGALDQLERPVTTSYARSDTLHKEQIKLRLVNLLFAGNTGIKIW